MLSPPALVFETPPIDPKGCLTPKDQKIRFQLISGLGRPPILYTYNYVYSNSVEQCTYLQYVCI